jgi:HPt (histidine-containing phosphotransfer) domain-containing protein
LYKRAMAYDPGAIDATLAAAVGDEPQLIAELRSAFTDGVQRGLDGLTAAQGVDDWRGAAARLKGLAASFGAIRLMAIAGEAIDAEPHDAAVMRKLKRAVERL